MFITLRYPQESCIHHADKLMVTLQLIAVPQCSIANPVIYASQYFYEKPNTFRASQLHLYRNVICVIRVDPHSPLDMVLLFLSCFIEVHF